MKSHGGSDDDGGGGSDDDGNLNIFIHILVTYACQG